MDGALALQMWAEGNREPVVEYCSQDVVATHDLAMAAHARKVLHWKSKSGRPQTMMLQNSWAAVEQAMRSPHAQPVLDDGPHHAGALHLLAPRPQAGGKVTHPARGRQPENARSRANQTAREPNAPPMPNA